MGKGIWGTITKGFEKGWLSKNDRNMKKFQAKQERGPVKTLFHITRNENVDNIMNQGLQANPAGKVNENSANHPFANVGVDEGGVWVTNSPNVFPVYGTTIGSVRGPREKALSTIRIDVPKEHLPNMTAVYNPYGIDSKLIAASDPNLFANFEAFNGMPAPTTAILSDMKPEWLTDLGYVEHHLQPRVSKEYAERAENVDRADNLMFGLDKGTLKDLTGTTGHRIPNMAGRSTKSPQRYAIDFVEHNLPIIQRLPVWPAEVSPSVTAFRQGNVMGIPEDITGRPLPNELKRYSADFIPANTWSNEYRPYTPFGEKRRGKNDPYEFAAGAVSRGIGGAKLPPIKDRVFNWKKYKEALQAGAAPNTATLQAVPRYQLDWNNIISTNMGYTPKVYKTDRIRIEPGPVSRGMSVPDDFVDFDDEILIGRNEPLTSVKEIAKDKAKDIVDEFNARVDYRPVLRIADIDNPTWQEIVRAIMQYRVNYGDGFE